MDILFDLLVDNEMETDIIPFTDDEQDDEQDDDIHTIGDEIAQNDVDIFISHQTIDDIISEVDSSLIATDGEYKLMWQNDGTWNGIQEPYVVARLIYNSSGVEVGYEAYGCATKDSCIDIYNAFTNIQMDEYLEEFGTRYILSFE
jgi:hypothetical protein